MLTWSLECGAANLYPVCRHDRTVFDPVSDVHRVCLQGPLGVVLAVVQIRADWPAYCQMFGMRQWSHKVCPCPYCDITQKDILKVPAGVTLDVAPWQDFTQEQYDAELRRCSKVP